MSYCMSVRPVYCHSSVIYFCVREVCSLLVDLILDWFSIEDEVCMKWTDNGYVGCIWPLVVGSYDLSWSGESFYVSAGLTVGRVVHSCSLEGDVQSPWTAINCRDWQAPERATLNPIRAYNDSTIPPLLGREKIYSYLCTMVWLTMNWLIVRPFLGFHRWL